MAEHAERRARAAYTVREAARELTVSERLLRKLVAAGRIRCVRIGRRVVIPASVLDGLLRDEHEGEVAA